MKCSICGKNLMKTKHCETCNACSFKVQGHYERDGQLYCMDCWTSRHCNLCPPKSNDEE